MKEKDLPWVIKKEFLGPKTYHVWLNNSMGEVLELDDYEMARVMVETLNANTDSNCRYSLHQINKRDI